MIVRYLFSGMKRKCTEPNRLMVGNGKMKKVELNQQNYVWWKKLWRKKTLRVLIMFNVLMLSHCSLVVVAAVAVARMQFEIFIISLETKRSKMIENYIIRAQMRVISTYCFPMIQISSRMWIIHESFDSYYFYSKEWKKLCFVYVCTKKLNEFWFEIELKAANDKCKSQKGT